MATAKNRKKKVKAGLVVKPTPTKQFKRVSFTITQEAIIKFQAIARRNNMTDSAAATALFSRLASTLNLMENITNEKN